MKVLVTGANGFIGKNLVAELKNRNIHDLFLATRDTSDQEWNNYLKECDFIFHLAGENRPKDTKAFYVGNRDLTNTIINKLKSFGRKTDIVFASSIQAEKNNDYGKSKKASEDIIYKYASESGSKAYVYRLCNVFGKWSKPNYNTVVATFCTNISHGKEIIINDTEALIKLVYIDDVVSEFINVFENKAKQINVHKNVEPIYSITVGELSKILYAFKESRNDLFAPDFSKEIVKKLYSTYLSFLPENEFKYSLKMNEDERGSFTEFVKTQNNGQVSINVSKTGITKGNHWHHTKNEKFLVVSGEGLIQFRRIDSEEIIEYRVCGKKLEVVDIPVGYTHNIINIGDVDMVTVMWANETFDPQNPDTYYLEV